MSSLTAERRQVNLQAVFEAVLAEAYASLMAALGVRMTHLLNRAVDELLGRARYERRRHVAYAIEGGECQRCHARHSQGFSRNGSRQRGVAIRWGHLVIRWPRVVCQCGGSVRLNFQGWLAPYQRLSDEIDSLIQRWAALALSLRQMQQELAHSYIGPLALRTLTQRLHQLAALTPDLDAQAIPPVVELDAIYITQLRPNGEVRKDRQGRKRPVKGRFKRCVLIALGVWPETGQQEVLAWQLADDEGFTAWLAFLSRLEAQGLSVENGLRLLIHDGAAGLISALDFLDLGAADQRCLFHKLRNIAKAILLPDDLPKEERWQKRRAVLRDFQAIFKARDYHTAVQRCWQVYLQYRHSQPKAVAALRSDLRKTLTYYHILRQQPTWPRRYLRTTARLERFNRSLRKHARSAGAYHSDTGLLAMIAQTADQAFQPGRPARAKRHPFSTT